MCWKPRKYCEGKYIVISLGHRLGTYISGKDVWWDYASENIAKDSFVNVLTAIKKTYFLGLNKFLLKMGIELS